MSRIKNKTQTTSVRVNPKMRKALKKDHGMTVQQLLDKAFLKLYDVEVKKTVTYTTEIERKKVA